MTHHMLCSTILVVGAVTSVAQGTPSGIRLVQQVYTVWGNAGDPVTHAYYASSAESLTESVSAIGIDGLLNTARSTAGPGILSAYRNGDAGVVNAYAQSAYLFTPDYRHLALHVSGTIGEWAFENVARLRITDLAIPALVYSFESPHELDELDPVTITGYTFSFQHDLLVDPAHMYELIAEVEAHRGEPGSGLATMSVEFSSIPAPGAIVLGALGTTLVTCLLRRKKL